MAPSFILKEALEDAMYAQDQPTNNDADEAPVVEPPGYLPPPFLEYLDGDLSDQTDSDGEDAREVGLLDGSLSGVTQFDKMVDYSDRPRFTPATRKPRHKPRHSAKLSILSTKSASKLVELESPSTGKRPRSGRQRLNRAAGRALAQAAAGSAVKKTHSTKTSPHGECFSCQF